MFLETQSWQKRLPEDFEELDGAEMSTSDDCGEVWEAVEYIITTFRAPLEAKGMCVPSIQDEVEDVVSYARKYLPIRTENYHKIWYKLHTCPDTSRWPNIFLLSELAFSLSFSTSHVEQLFSQLKVIKTKRRTSMLNSTLHDLLEINVEGPPLQSFNALAPVQLWWKDSCTSRRVNQNPRKEYQPRATSNPEEEMVTESSSSGTSLALSG